jgi:hypothetical protein
MTFTTKVTVNWTNSIDRLNPELMDQRKQKIYEMTATGQTDGLWINLSTTSGQRNFIDQAAANTYVEWLSNATNALSLEMPTVEISQI